MRSAARPFPHGVRPAGIAIPPDSGIADAEPGGRSPPGLRGGRGTGRVTGQAGLSQAPMGIGGAARTTPISGPHQNTDDMQTNAPVLS